MSQPDKTGPNPEDAKVPPTIGVKLRVDVMTNTMINDKERGFSLLLIAIPMSVSKFAALGFLWDALDGLATFYKHAEAQYAKQQNGGIVKATMADAMRLGKDLLRGG